MKLIALKHISPQRPKGSTFEESNRTAKMLIAMKAARAVDDDESPRPRRYRTRALQANTTTE